MTHCPIEFWFPKFNDISNNEEINVFVVSTLVDVCVCEPNDGYVCGAYGEYTSRCAYYIDTCINHIPPLLVIYLGFKVVALVECHTMNVHAFI
jgi:hypothetical protein